MIENQDRVVKVAHDDLMARLPGLHAPIAKLIEGRSIHYLDAPIHANVGDLLIMLGTLRFFEKYNIKADVTAAHFNYNLSWAAKTDVVVFHGGGNFGDLYPVCQEFREHVIGAARHARIIVLPQTLHFRSAANAKRCAQSLRRHPDVHIFTRDKTSYALARQMSEHVYLVPDMAHQLWGDAKLLNSVPRRVGELSFMRTDGEIKASRSVTDGTDWPQMVGRRRELAIRYMRAMSRRLHLMQLGRLTLSHEMDAWIWFARRLAAQSAAIFSGANQVVTDRLHGHILSCLVSTPNRVLDNGYGKNSSYVSQWTIRSNLVSAVDF